MAHCIIALVAWPLAANGLKPFYFNSDLRLACCAGLALHLQEDRGDVSMSVASSRKLQGLSAWNSCVYVPA